MTDAYQDRIRKMLGEALAPQLPSGLGGLAESIPTEFLPRTIPMGPFDQWLVSFLAALPPEDRRRLIAELIEQEKGG